MYHITNLKVKKHHFEIMLVLIINLVCFISIVNGQDLKSRLLLPGEVIRIDSIIIIGNETGGRVEVDVTVSPKINR